MREGTISDIVQRVSPDGRFPCVSLVEGTVIRLLPERPFRVPTWAGTHSR